MWRTVVFLGPDGWKTTTAQGVSPGDVHFRWSPKHQDMEVISKSSLPVYLSAPGENKTRLLYPSIIWSSFSFFHDWCCRPLPLFRSPPFVSLIFLPLPSHFLSLPFIVFLSSSSSSLPVTLTCFSFLFFPFSPSFLLSSHPLLFPPFFSSSLLSLSPCHPFLFFSMFLFSPLLSSLPLLYCPPSFLCFTSNFRTFPFPLSHPCLLSCPVWTPPSSHSFLPPVSFSPLLLPDQVCLSSPTAPYLGNHLLSYGQNFSFLLRLDRGVRHPSTNDVILEGGGLRVSTSLGDLRSIVPCGQKISYSFRSGFWMVVVQMWPPGFGPFLGAAWMLFLLLCEHSSAAVEESCCCNQSK